MITEFFLHTSDSDELKEALNSLRKILDEGCSEGSCSCNDSLEKAKRKRVLENLEKEPRLSVDTRNSFVNNLVENFKGCCCSGVMEVIIKAQDQSITLMLEGPKVTHMKDELCHVMPGEKLVRLTRESPVENLIKSVEDGDIGVGLLSKPLTGKRSIVWATFADNINSIRSEKGEGAADKIRDMLGLAYESYKKGTYLVGLFYDKGKVSSTFSKGKSFHYPTVIEGGDSPAFKPAPVGEDTGITINLKDGAKGFPEIVHPSIENPSQSIKESSVIVLGQLKTDPPENYLKDYLT